MGELYIFELTRTKEESKGEGPNFDSRNFLKLYIPNYLVNKQDIVPWKFHENQISSRLLNILWVDAAAG